MVYLNVHWNQRRWEPGWDPPSYMFESLTTEAIWLPTLGPEPDAEASMLITASSHSALPAPWVLLQRSWLHTTHRKLGANTSMLQKRKASPSLPVLPHVVEEKGKSFTANSPSGQLVYQTWRSGFPCIWCYHIFLTKKHLSHEGILWALPWEQSLKLERKTQA